VGIKEVHEKLGREIERERGGRRWNLEAERAGLSSRCF
jgi:hypothetical protein